VRGYRGARERRQWVWEGAERFFISPFHSDYFWSFCFTRLLPIIILLLPILIDEPCVIFRCDCAYLILPSSTRLSDTISSSFSFIAEVHERSVIVRERRVRWGDFFWSSFWLLHHFISFHYFSSWFIDSSSCFFSSYFPFFLLPSFRSFSLSSFWLFHFIPSLIHSYFHFIFIYHFLSSYFFAAFDFFLSLSLLFSSFHYFDFIFFFHFLSLIIDFHFHYFIFIFFFFIIFIITIITDVRVWGAGRWCEGRGGVARVERVSI